MQLSWLADALRAEGLTVVEHTGWADRSMRPFNEFSPVALLNHHTAGSSILTDYPGPPYYRDTSLQTKCNVTIRGDGTVVVLNAGWAADSGYGDRLVLNAVQADRPLPPPTDTYTSTSPEVVPGGSNPGRLGNAWFIDIEVQHLGNGDPIAAVQREALIRSNAAICRRMGWDPRTRVIGHREWTKRKTDPRWDGDTNPMPGIRADTYQRLTEGDFEMAWQPGQPATEVKTVADIDRVFAEQGTFFAGQNVGTYLMGRPESEARLGILLGLARMVVNAMEFHGRLLAEEGEGGGIVGGQLTAGQIQAIVDQRITGTSLKPPA